MAISFAESGSNGSIGADNGITSSSRPWFARGTPADLHLVAEEEATGIAGDLRGTAQVAGWPRDDAAMALDRFDQDAGDGTAGG